MVSQGEIYPVSCPKNDALVDSSSVPGKDRDFSPELRLIWQPYALLLVKRLLSGVAALLQVGAGPE